MPDPLQSVMRILLVETATPKRVRRTAEQILAGELYPNAQVTILCTDEPETIEYFNELAGVRLVTLERMRKKELLQKLRKENFEILRVFWTGEKRYRAIKLFALRLRNPAMDIDIGDGSVFRFNWKGFIRHALFRWAHPLPTDHWELVPKPKAKWELGPQPKTRPVGEQFKGERVLIIQSAAPRNVVGALDALDQKNVFREPRYTVFCRSNPEITESLRRDARIHEVRTHDETRHSWRHFLELRRERFDAVVVLFTGDPGYWKIKCFAFLLRARHRVVFNENNDGFFLSWRAWFSLILHRMGERSRHGGGSLLASKARGVSLVLLKLLLLPFRFVWLLGVWVRLRLAGR